MARLFVLEVMNQSLAGASAVAYSSGNLYERLGQADQFAFQLVVDQFSGTTGSVTLDFQDSNEGSDGLFSSSSAGTAPITASITVAAAGTYWVGTAPTRTLGGFGRVMIKLPSSGISSIAFRLYVCGRSNG